MITGVRSFLMIKSKGNKTEDLSGNCRLFRKTATSSWSPRSLALLWRREVQRTFWLKNEHEDLHSSFRITKLPRRMTPKWMTPFLIFWLQILCITQHCALTHNEINVLISLSEWNSFIALQRQLRNLIIGQATTVFWVSILTRIVRSPMKSWLLPAKNAIKTSYQQDYCVLDLPSLELFDRRGPENDLPERPRGVY